MSRLTIAQPWSKATMGNTLLASSLDRWASGRRYSDSTTKYSLPKNQFSLCSQWKLTSYGGDRYTIENEDHKLYVVPRSQVMIGGSVCGVRVNTSVAWMITELSSDEYGPDVYRSVVLNARCCR